MIMSCETYSDIFYENYIYMKEIFKFGEING